MGAQPDTAERDHRLAVAEALARRLDRPMGVLGVVFLFVVLGQLLARSGPLVTMLNVLSWLCWAVFVGEFLLRGYVAGFQRRFWRRNWWQILFLLVPFLRFFKALQSLRFIRSLGGARFGTVLSAGVRSSRSAGRLLSSRLAWLAAVTAIVVLVSSQLLYVTGAYPSYAPALHDAAMTAITGTNLTAKGSFARFLEVIMAIYSIAVFATLAGSFGAYFLRPEAGSAGPPST